MDNSDPGIKSRPISKRRGNVMIATAFILSASVYGLSIAYITHARNTRAATETNQKYETTRKGEDLYVDEIGQRSRQLYIDIGSDGNLDIFISTTLSGMVPYRVLAKGDNSFDDKARDYSTNIYPSIRDNLPKE